MYELAVMTRTRHGSDMRVIAWLVEDTWAPCLDAALEQVAGDDELVLLHVRDGEVEAAAHGAFGGLIGRRQGERDPAVALSAEALDAERALLDRAAQRAGRPTTEVTRAGRVEREVVAAADTADLLVIARDGDRDRLGPKSLGRHTRFVVDHAPCAVLLIWPDGVPPVGSIPPPPAHGPHAEHPHGKRPHDRRPHGPEHPPRPGD